MKLTTTFWSDKVHEFSKLLYINGKNKEMMFETDLNDIFRTFIFFKEISKFVKSQKVRNTINNNAWERDAYYQFATVENDDILPIKWFNLIVDEKTTISHDIAFETTLIKRNDIVIPFGKFPMAYYSQNIKLPKYREFNIKSKAYNFIANQIKKSFN